MTRENIEHINTKWDGNGLYTVTERAKEGPDRLSLVRSGGGYGFSHILSLSV